MACRHLADGLLHPSADRVPGVHQRRELRPGQKPQTSVGVPCIGLILADPLPLPPQVKLIWSFLLPTLVITLVVFPMTKFSPGRSYAIFLLVVYAAFILMAVLTELQIIRLPW